MLDRLKIRLRVGPEMATAPATQTPARPAQLITRPDVASRLQQARKLTSFTGDLQTTSKAGMPELIHHGAVSQERKRHSAPGEVDIHITRVKESLQQPKETCEW